MPYADGTEIPRGMPAHCPLCRGKLELRWRGQISSKPGRGYVAVASPFFVCKACEIAVRIQSIPSEPLRPSRKAARADVAAEIRQKNERMNDQIANQRSMRGTRP